MKKGINLFATRTNAYAIKKTAPADAFY